MLAQLLILTFDAFSFNMAETLPSSYKEFVLKEIDIRHKVIYACINLSSIRLL